MSATAVHHHKGLAGQVNVDVLVSGDAGKAGRREHGRTREGETWYPIDDPSCRKGTKPGKPCIEPEDRGVRGHRQDGLVSDGKNTVDTGRYLIQADEDKVRVYDKTTDTWLEAWGDPHLKTGDGDKAQFHENITIDLKDGTKMTIKTTPKDANGIAWIDSVAITKGEEAVVVGGLHDGKAGVEAGNVLNNADAVDAQYEDGTVLRAGRQVDDLTFASNGKEVVGEDKTQRWGEHMLDGNGGRSTNSRRPETKPGEGPKHGGAHSRDKSDGNGKAGRNEKPRHGDQTPRTRSSNEGTQTQEDEAPAAQSPKNKPPKGEPEDVPPLEIPKVDFDANSMDEFFGGLASAADNLENKIIDFFSGGKELNETELAQLQILKDKYTRLTTMLTNMMQSDHEAKMAAIRNLKA